MEKVDSGTPESGTLSRRATLAKGAAAGALAWTTPVVLSTSAHAGTTCTLKCAPQFTYQIKAYKYLTNGGFLGVNQGLFVYADVVGVSGEPVCPCGLPSGTPSTTPSSVTLTGGVFEYTSALGDLTAGVANSQTNTNVSGATGFNLTFVDALNNGTTFTGCVRVEVMCQDRAGANGGDPTYRSCTRSINWSYPGASTGTTLNVTSAFELCSGTISCDAASGMPICGV